MNNNNRVLHRYLMVQRDNLKQTNQNDVFEMILTMW